MPTACSQCENPMLKGIHSCGIDGPRPIEPDSVGEALAAYMAMRSGQPQVGLQCNHGEDPISVLAAHMSGSGPQGVQFGCTCGSSGAHYPPCPFAPVSPQAAPLQFTGWVCPVCGGGVGPFVQRCPCRPVVGDGASIMTPVPQSLTKGA